MSSIVLMALEAAVSTEDCAAVCLNAQALNQHALTGIYEICPR